MAVDVKAVDVKAVDVKTPAGYIDMTPTWEAVLPILLEVVQNGSATVARSAAIAELTRMAKLADRYVADQRVASQEGKP